MTIKLSEVAKEKGIEYFLISFVDMGGALRAKLVPAAAIDKMQEDGAGFAGFAAAMDMTPAHPDMLAKPDPETLIQLPWKPEVGWLASDCWMDDAPVASSPRVLLKSQIEKAAAEGYRMKSGVECEFFLIDANEMRVADHHDSARKPCYDQLALMRQYDVIKRICDYMQQLGWGPYQNDHEDGNGQFEMNWNFDDALVTADRHVFFKYMVKTVAEEYGMRATFMPKPFNHLTGSGCHAHVSLWDTKGKKNLFLDGSNDPLGMSMTAYSFLGGVMNEAEALASIFNPTVNSFKRIDSATTLSGATWSPNAITYSGDNRTHMIRIPEPGRFEMRLMDGASNPYLMQAGVLATGMDGIEHERDPGKPMYNNMYEDGQRLKRVRRLPLNLLDAARLTSKSKVLRRQLGDEFIDSHVKLRFDEWRRYATTLSQWEVENTFDC
ncbi:type III glutamate--ammonia ligase [Ferruginivarius sediminum]|uniref:Type III glutamate--ammonia ligase n=1 Tax=Ferruginivarius sediminum TaxID=2661937 RepID=A0A369T6R6_9PROT|nr:type III glutamate--ammonia ligase [Ferruginivarius sediminum]RDD61021.1 type III glutamate--ammonia ligase [Ferruginivarius sediminum]